MPHNLCVCVCVEGEGTIKLLRKQLKQCKTPRPITKIPKPLQTHPNNCEKAQWLHRYPIDCVHPKMIGETHQTNVVKIQAITKTLECTMRASTAAEP